MKKVALVLFTVALFPACATVPPPAPVVVPFEQKMADILRLEDQRILKDPAPAVIAPPVTKGRKPQVAPAPTPVPDLTAFLADSEGRVRRRAALAIGRVGLRDGVAPVAALLADPDVHVRQMAAFALGLIGDASGTAALTKALSDADPLVRGKAAEALGQIGAKDVAAAIGTFARDLVRHPAVTSMSPDDEKWPGGAEAEALKLALFALVRLGAYDPLAAAVVENGRPVSNWWPIAFALQRINDPRAVPALTALAKGPGKYTVSFAARGLGGSKDPSAAAALLPLLDRSRPLEVKVAAVRAVAQLNAESAVDPLLALVNDTDVDPNLKLEVVTALGTMRAASGLAVVQDLMTDPWPVMRIAATRAAARIDPDTFLLVLASLEPDRDWTVRSAFAGVLATMPPEAAVDRVRAMLEDEDKRVWPAAMRALVQLKVPDAPAMLLAKVKEPDFAVRAAVSTLIGEVKPEGGAAALREAYKIAQPDLSYLARTAAMEALVKFGPAEATETLKLALADKEWAVRVRAAELLADLDPAGDYRAAIRPVPSPALAPYNSPALISPDFSPHVFIDTAKGTIEFELAMLDAPQTSHNFITLARKGFFNGLAIHRVVPNFVVQDGDSRGDGEGGPGYSIRDELNERPFLRGTVGMALSWKDTGGSQFFIMHSPAPHLDARYTAFGHVVNGMEVVDKIQQGDLIQRVRVWDGRGWQ